MNNEYTCIHVWPCLADFSVKPCEKCGAIREHIQMLDDLEDAVIEQHREKGLAFHEARNNRIAYRARILALMAEGQQTPTPNPE